MDRVWCKNVPRPNRTCTNTNDFATELDSCMMLVEFRFGNICTCSLLNFSSYFICCREKE